MKYHAEFYRAATDGELIAGLGDRSVVVIDGRLANCAIQAIAADECKRRGFVAYRIMRGDRFTTATPATRIVNVSRRSDLETISERLECTR